MKKIIFIVLALVVLGTGGFFGYKVFASKEGDKKESKVDFAKAIELQIILEQITTNLNKDNHFVITSFTVQADSDDAKKEFENRLSEMKSLSIQTFNNLSKSEIIGENGSKKVIDALLDVYNKNLTSGTITNVFLTEFKVQ